MDRNLAMYREFHKVMGKFEGLFHAIKKNNVNIVETMLKQEKLGYLKLDNRFTGYTILHFACMRGEYDCVKSLLLTYNVDPNKVAVDSARPITIVVLSANYEIVELLLNTGANINFELSPRLHIKYIDRFQFKSSKYDEWFKDFGFRMTLLTYAVLKNNCRLVNILIRHNADVRIKSRSNRTLLMCAVDTLQEKMVESLLTVMTKNDINIRDNDGFTALHYLVKNQIQFRETIGESILTSRISDIMLLLIRAGADINITINGDPGTLFVNMVAFRSMFYLLPNLLPYYTYSENFRPLFYATKAFNKFRSFHPNSIINICETKVCIIEDLRLRQILGLPVPKEEILIMEHFIEDCPDYIVRSTDVRVHVAIVSWMDTLITFGSKSMSIFDILTTSDSKFLQLAKDQSFCTAINIATQKRSRHISRIEVRIEQTKKRIELLDKFSKISYYVSQVFYHLPFYCILHIFDYLPYNDLENFANALFLKEELENNETVLIKQY